MTTEDLIVGIWRRFAAPGWERKVQDIQAGRLSVRAGVSEVFATIPTSKAGEIMDYTRSTVRFRSGLEEFLAFCQEKGVPVAVASGGLDFFLLPMLERWTSGERPLISRVYVVPADLSGPFIKVLPPYACQQCSLCKAAVLREHAGSYRVLIGDGVTDLHGALEADKVFARGQLQGLLAGRGRPYVPFEDFFDVRRGLEEARLE